VRQDRLAYSGKALNDSASGSCLPQANTSHTCQCSPSSVQSFGPEGQGQGSSQQSLTETRSQVRYRLLLQTPPNLLPLLTKEGLLRLSLPSTNYLLLAIYHPPFILILLSLYTLILSILSVVSDPFSRFYRRRQFDLLMPRISTR
jgi:hypothetical protein